MPGRVLSDGGTTAIGGISVSTGNLADVFVPAWPDQHDYWNNHLLSRRLWREGRVDDRVGDFFGFWYHMVYDGSER